MTQRSDPYGFTPAARPYVERRKRSPKGRKFWMTITLFGAPFVTTSAALFTDRMPAETYVGFLEITLPLALAAFLGSNVAQKVGLAKATADTPAATIVNTPAMSVQVGG